MNHNLFGGGTLCRLDWSSPHLFEIGAWICGAAHTRTGVSAPHKHCHTDERPFPFFAAKGPLTTPVFQEELVRSESDQRASSITDSM